MVKKVADELVVRPFEGLPAEADIVSMREIIPGASIPVTTTKEFGAISGLLVTQLPGGAAALLREDGVVLADLQSSSRSLDASQDVAQAFLAVSELEPGTAIQEVKRDPAGPRLQDILDLSKEFVITVHNDYDFWLSPEQDVDPALRRSLDEAAETMVDTRKLKSIPHGYWCRMGSKEYLRWALPLPEADVLNGLARLHAARETAWDGTKLLGAFRAGGISIPVWQLPKGAEAEEIEDAAASFEKKLLAAIASKEPLTVMERRAKDGLSSRQVTLR